jgi:hypothetical protein
MQNYKVNDIFKRGEQMFKVIAFTNSKKSIYVEDINNKNIQHTCRINKYFGKPKIKINGAIYTKIQKGE